MPPLVYDAAVAHLENLVDAVSELVTAILDMNGCMTVRHVTSMHIGDARQFWLQKIGRLLVRGQNSDTGSGRQIATEHRTLL